MQLRRVSLVGAVVALTVATLPLAASADAPTPTPARTEVPASIAVLGDSISTATGASGPLGAERPQHSWSTGTTASVNSNYQRLLALDPAISGNNDTLAANGQRMTHMAAQASNLDPGTDYVQVQLGGNDLCRPSVGEMTPVETYRQQFVEGLGAIAENAPDAIIGVTSVPDIYNLWYIRYAPSSVNGQESNQAGQARTYVNLSIIPCLSLLANPASTAAADEARRQEVRERNIAFNQVLEQECAKVLRCRFDDHATFNLSSNRADPPHGPILPRSEWTFTDLDISRNAGGFAGALCPLTGITGSSCGDHFHPSLAGQAKLAEVAWESLFDFGDSTAPELSSTVDPGPNAAGWHNGPATVTFTATDEAGVVGIEHRIHGPDGTAGEWVATFEDTAELTVMTEGTSHVEARAMDLNGNLSESEVVTVQVDETDPQITLSVPGDDQVVTLGESVAAQFECSDALSGVASCEGTVDDGDDIDTASVGEHDFVVETTDIAGNTATLAHTYEVHYAWSGPGAPLRDQDRREFRSNQAVPVRFSLGDADGALDPSATPAIYVAEPGQYGEPASQPGDGHPGNIARWDSSDEQYVFNLDTRGLASGEWELVVRPGDGSAHRIPFTIR